MIKKLTEQELTSFGNYLLTVERQKKIVTCENFSNNVEFPDDLSLMIERMRQVSHADFENWKANND